MEKFKQNEKFDAINQFRPKDNEAYQYSHYQYMTGGSGELHTKVDHERKSDPTKRWNTDSKREKNLVIDNGDGYEFFDNKPEEHPNSNVISFSSPRINFLHRETKKLTALLNANCNPHYSNFDDLTPRSKAAAGSKITRKLNFGLNEVVFKNLVPINVNDSVLMPDKPIPFKSKYRKENKAIMSPDLSDFLTPVRPLTHYLDLPNYTCVFEDDPIDPLSFYSSLYKN